MPENSSMQEDIYNIICGYCTLQKNIPEQYRIIKNEFEDGSACDTAYRHVMEACSRLCRRLGTTEWEDPDVEIIINELLDIGRHLAFKMFDYGQLLGEAADVPSVLVNGLSIAGK